MDDVIELEAQRGPGLYTPLSLKTEGGGLGNLLFRTIARGTFTPLLIVELVIIVLAMRSFGRTPAARRLSASAPAAVVCSRKSALHGPREIP